MGFPVLPAGVAAVGCGGDSDAELGDDLCADLEDDDGDGLVDCLAPDCDDQDECAGESGGGD